MDLKTELEHLRHSLSRAEGIQSELDRRVFHLKTLYDVSKDIFSHVDTETILRVFLMMTMGNFGILEGFILTMDATTEEIDRCVAIGCDCDDAALRQAGRKVLRLYEPDVSLDVLEPKASPASLPKGIRSSLPFYIVPGVLGLLGLGGKLTDEPFDENDRELLVTLLNNLVVALKNARAFEQIQRLNTDLQAKNTELEETLRKLRSAMRKVEILESIKANLSKFVPTTVCRLIEKSPADGILESREQDVSVLFIDIEGYTRMCEKLGGAELNELVERYFSVFMDAIYANNGDVNETAGDGLMVLFLNEDPQVNALEAVRTAVAIREETLRINSEAGHHSQPVVVNIGTHSGPALVGAAKFESYTGSRWTYTARGITVNIAARLGALATGGAIFLSRVTADRVADHFPLTCAGCFQLKNVSNDVEVFSV